MAQNLFEGHSYTFKQNSGSLMLLDSTDNSHEQITFRKGLISSGSMVMRMNGQDEWAMHIQNYNYVSFPAGTTSADKGIKISVGDNTQVWSGDSTSAHYLYFYEGNNTSYAGRIYSVNNGVVYATFTGAHEARLLESDSKSANIIAPSTGSEGRATQIYKNGTIVSIVKAELVELSEGLYNNQPVQYCVTSSTYQDKRVFGVYSNSDNEGSDEISDNHNINSLGDGIILVNNQNGNIENGDYITTASGSGGYGCKQNSEFLANYTVAKSLEDVDWSTEPSSSKLIACTYHCG